MANASSAGLQGWRGGSELEQRLYLSTIGMASGSGRWRMGWWSSVREQSDNGTAVVASEHGGGRR